MAVYLEENTTLQKGARQKKIDPAGIHMTMDAMQRYQYTHPVKSTVRELMSNMIDSIREKLRAWAILTGKAKPSDYYADLEGDIYKDSKWQPEYFDLKYLDMQKNTAKLRYYAKDGERDLVVFEDRGVGLGGRRLEGYFDLTFSTKRLDKGALGKWGVGAKSALSLGFKYYTMETWYNGRYFKFQIYDHIYYSLVPKFDLQAGRENGFIRFSGDTEEDEPIYWQPTMEPNGVRVTVEAKKHQRQQYVDAVKSQLLYFDNIDFAIVHDDGREEKVEYKANILYEDDLIVMSDNQYWSKPHILLNGVNYGHIDWNELELEDIRGNIGIKVAPEDVEINMSRESVLWTDATKAKVLERFEQVVEIAQKRIQEELQETDLLKWIKTCEQVHGKWGQSNGVVGRLANIVDLSKLDLAFTPEPKITFKKMGKLEPLFRRTVQLIEKREKNKVTKSIERELACWWGQSRPAILLKLDEKVSNRKDKYLLSLYPQGFIQVHEPYASAEKFAEAEKDGRIPVAMAKYLTEGDGGKFSFVFASLYWEYLVQSQSKIWYDAVEVPKEFTGNDDAEEVQEEKTVEEEKQEEVERQSTEQRRKLEGKTILQTPSLAGGSDSKPDLTKYFSYAKLEVPIKSINDFQAEEIYVGTDADAEVMHLVAALTRDPDPLNILQGYGMRSYANDYFKWMESKYWRLNKDKIMEYTNWGASEGNAASAAFPLQNFFDAKVMLLKVAQANLKYYRDFERIQQFFIKIKNNTITMSNTLIQWNTARIIRERLSSAAFLYNFEEFNPAYAALYKELTTYIDKNYREVEAYTGKDTYGLTSDTYKHLILHLDNVRQFQEAVQKGMPTEQLGQLAGSLFGNKELKDGMAVDPRMMEILEQVLEFSRGVGEMLNYIPTLTGYTTPAPGSGLFKTMQYTPGQTRQKFACTEELEQEIRAWLDYKGVLETTPAQEQTEPPIGNQQLPVEEQEEAA